MSKAQRAATSAELGLTAAQQKQISSNVSLLGTGKMLTQSSLEQFLANKNVTVATQEKIIADLQSNNVIKSGLITSKADIDLVLEKMVAEGVCTEATKEQARAELLKTSTMKVSTSVTWAQVKASLALMATNPATWIMLGVTAISLIVKAYNEWNVTLEEHIDKLNEANSKYAESKSAYESAQSELSDVTAKIKELNDVSSSRKLSIVEQEDLDNLEKENKLLSQNVAYLRAKKKNALTDFAKEFDDTYAKAVKSSATAKLSENGFAQYKASNGGMNSFSIDEAKSNDLNSIIGLGYDQIVELRKQRIDQLQSEITSDSARLTQAIASNNTELIVSIQDEIDANKKIIEYQTSEIQDIVSKFDESYDTLFNESGGDFSYFGDSTLKGLTWVESARDLIVSVLDQTAEDVNDRFDAIINTDRFSGLTDKIKILAQEGTLTADSLNSQEFTPLIEQLQGLGLTIDDIIGRFNQLFDVSQNAPVVETNSSKYVDNSQPAYRASASKSAVGDVLSEFKDSGAITEEKITALDTAITGVSDAFFTSTGEISAAGAEILSYSDDVDKATVAVYDMMIAEKQRQMSLATTSTASAQLQSEIEALIRERDAVYDLSMGAKALNKVLSESTQNTDLLRTAIEDLSSGEFDDWGEEKYKTLIDTFPDLTDEVEQYARGQKDATDLQKDFTRAMADASLSDFEEGLSNVSSAVEKYGADSWQAIQAVQNLESIIPGLTGLLFDESGALTEVGQAALLAAAGNKEAALAMLQGALAAAQLDLSNATAQWNGLAQAAGGAFSAQMAAAAATDLAGKQASVDQINAMIASIKIPKFSFGSGGGSSSGGGGSAKKDVLEDYKNQKKILDHRIDMSESTQDLMEEESDTWEAEQKNQYSIYVEYANLIEAEMERLRKLGYSNTSDEMMELEKDLASVRKSMYDIQKKAFEEMQDAKVAALQKEKDAAQKAHEAEMDRLDAEIDRQTALIGLLESQYDLTNDIRSQRNELTKELAKAQTYVGLSDEEKEALFSSEDYAQLNKVLNDLQSESVIMYNDYVNEIKSVNVDEAYKLDYITSQYEAQYALMGKKYEIAKQELALARARIALDNAQQNRNVAMIVDGKWTWSADPETVQSAMEDIYSAEENKAQAQGDYIQQEKINELEVFKASIEMEREAAESAYDMLMDSIDEMMEAIEKQKFVFNESIENMEDYNTALVDSAESLRDAAQEAISGIKSAAGEALAQLKNSDSGDNKTTSISAGKVVLLNSKSNSAPKSTRSSYSPSYWTGFREEAYADGGVVDYTGRAQVHGTAGSPEVVFNATDAAKLYDLIHNGGYLTEMMNMLKKDSSSFASSAVSSKAVQETPKVQYIVNGLTFGESSGNLTLKELANQLSSVAPLLR